MIDARSTASEAIRVLRQVKSTFSRNRMLTGSAFLAAKPGYVITCAHVVFDNNENALSIKVGGKDATIVALHKNLDIAVLKVSETETSSYGNSRNLELGVPLIFAGYPTGVAGPSVFSGILSAQGNNLISSPKCRILQVNGMINSGNSGGPLFIAGTNEIVGVITAKHVPLLTEVDKLLDLLKNMPQFPSEVGIGQIDFAKFVNHTIQSFRVIAGSLRLVQIGTGYAVPIDLLPEIKE